MPKNSSTSSSRHPLIVGLIFVLPLLLIIIALDAVLTGALKKSNHEDISYLQRIFTGEINSDILVSGSSRALVHFDCGEIEYVTGKTCFNMGMNGTGVHLQLPLLKEYLESNEKPELIIQEVGFTSLNKPSEERLIFNQKQYAPFMNRDEIYEALSRFDSDLWKYKYIPLYGFMLHRDNMNDAIRSLLGDDLSNRRLENGYRPTNRAWDGSFEKFKEKNPDGINVSIDREFADYLDEIVRTATEAGIPVALVYTPEYIENQRLTNNRQLLTGHYQELADNYDATFLNYSDSELVYEIDNFYNSQHLNAGASTAFSNLLARDLEEILFN